MKDLSALVANLRRKAEKLVEKYQVVIEQNKQLTNEVFELKEELNKRNQQLSEMENKIKVLKISKSVDSESTKDVKLKINEMVREIDKCIAQINK
ncbi:MAG: hypothetical protein KF732_01530 [Flavobacteriales bacterium]|nr:hypothetical protein [Flavobacteriales bacterium]MBV6485955.1 hypothetical protein [Flavobacteriales bacterium]MBX2958612.1 hypothetical protein [Flavobacteriales bacterium]MCL4857629.1 hypothetical protein [Flavobacteriales bacterium]